MMTLRQIRHFIAVAETGSISAAAQAVFISQSTLTLAIQQLEEEIGVRLFDRHAKGMTLTHQGHQFLRQAHLILATVENAKRSLQQSTDQVAGSLTIGVTSLVAGYYLADLINRFQRAFPNVKTRVVEDERPYIEHLLVSGEIDVGVLILSNLEDRHALQTEVLTHSPHRLWLPAPPPPQPLQIVLEKPVHMVFVHVGAYVPIVPVPQDRDIVEKNIRPLEAQLIKPAVFGNHVL